MITNRKSSVGLFAEEEEPSFLLGPPNPITPPLPHEPLPRNTTPDNILLNILLSSNTSSHNSSWVIYSNCFITRILFTPCLLTMLLSSIILIFLIRRYLRDGTILYFSVIVYSLCQILMFVVIIQDVILSSWSLSSLLFCKIRSTSEIFVLVMSAYSILFMTGVRFVFIQRPLHYRTYLKLRYQLVLELVKVVLAASLTISPILLGLCELDIEQEKFCHFQIGEGPCMAFHILCVGVGIVLPVFTTTVLYAVIYKTILRLKNSQKMLEPSALVGRTKSDNSDSQETSAKTASSVVSRRGKGHKESVTTLTEEQVMEPDTRSEAGDRARVRVRLPSRASEDSTSDTASNKPDLPSSLASKSTTKALMKAQFKRGMSHTSNLVRSVSRKQMANIRNMARESVQVPWSIMAVLILYIITTAPWITLIVAPQLWFKAISGELRLVLDLKYSIMFLGIACSPIATIITNKALRKSFWRWIYSFRRRR